MNRLRALAALAAVLVMLAGCAPPAETRRVDAPAARPPADPLDAHTFRIDKARESGEWAEGERSIARVPPELLGGYRRWFEARAHTFPPLWIYASARRLEEAGEVLKAAYWYIAARERQIRQLRRCRDDSAKEQLTWADAAFVSLRAEMGRHPELTRYAAKHAFAWLDLNEDTENGLLAACLRGAAGAERARGSRLVPVEGAGANTFRLVPPPVADPAEWLIPAPEIHDIRIWSRILMKQDVARILGEPEAEPPTPTITPLR